MKIARESRRSKKEIVIISVRVDVITIFRLVHKPGEHRKAVLTNENPLIIMRIMSELWRYERQKQNLSDIRMRHKNEAKAVKERSNRTTAQQRVAGR